MGFCHQDKGSFVLNLLIFAWLLRLRKGQDGVGRLPTHNPTEGV